MSIEQRRFIRFSFDLPVLRHKSNGEVVRTFIREVSAGGCLVAWDENILIDEQFRIELELPNKNRLPLLCKALYKFQGRGIGTKFINVSAFEQELLGQIISQTLEVEGVSLSVDPLAMPPTYLAHNSEEEEVIVWQPDEN